MADNEGARKTGKFIAVCTSPDVCKTPVGSSVVPIPYPITSDLSDSMSISSNVLFGGYPAYKHDKSIVSKVTGDEAGTAGGVKSGTNRSIVETVEGSSSFKVNKKPVVRNGDKCKMNNGNTMGKIIFQGTSASGGSGGSANPPVSPETPQEVKAAQEKKGLWSRMPEDKTKTEGKKKYSRNMSERRKALQRDATDPKSGLTKEQRDYIKANNGKRVPKDCEVSHNEPLELGKTYERKKALDTADNMTTMQKSEHRALHKTCGDTYHYVREVKRM